MQCSCIRSRNEFTDKHEQFLARYIAKYNPQKENRQGNELYKRLCANVRGLYYVSASTMTSQ